MPRKQEKLFDGCVDGPPDEYVILVIKSGVSKKTSIIVKYFDVGEKSWKVE